MTLKAQSVRLRLPNKLATTTFGNELAAAFNGGGIDAPPPPQFDRAVAWVVGTVAPNSYTNEIYPVQVEYVVGSGGTGYPASLPAQFTGDGSDDGGTIYVTNTAETSPDFEPQKGSHLLKVGKRVLAWATVDEDGTTTWLMNASVPELLDVDLTQNGGSDGAGAPTPSYNTYTYDVAYNGVTISDVLAPLTPTWQRDIGPVIPATKGTARYVNGTLTLLDHDEKTRGVVCTPPS